MFLEGAHLYRRKSLRADSWALVVGASPFLVRAVKFQNTGDAGHTVKEGSGARRYPQTAEEKVFAENDLWNSLKEGIYEEGSSGYAKMRKEEGLLLYSAFKVSMEWRGNEPEREIHHKPESKKVSIGGSCIVT